MATKKLKGLGRGLEALLGGYGDAPSLETGTPSTLPVAQLQAGKYQPRTRMDEGALNELAESIRTQGIARLISDFNFTHEQAATAVGRSRSAVSNLLRLMNLATPVQTMLMAGDIDMGHARALLAVDGATQIALANQVVAKRLSVRETEKMVTRAMEEQASGPAAKPKEKSGDIVALEEELSDRLATPVLFKMGPKGRGQLIIDFADLDVLDGVLARLRA